MVSLWSLAVIAFERWLVICKPLGNFVFKPDHALACCAFTWVFALIASVPPLVGWSRSVLLTHPHICTDRTAELPCTLSAPVIISPDISQKAYSAPVVQTGTPQITNTTMNPTWCSFSASALLFPSPPLSSATPSSSLRWKWWGKQIAKKHLKLNSIKLKCSKTLVYWKGFENRSFSMRH